MGERKVLNKYYPPDFDPAKLPRGKRQQNNEMKVRMMLPMSVRCKTCGNFMYKGTKFNTRKEDVHGETYLGIQLFRFYYRCKSCAAEFTMKTDPKTSDYILEEGASRNYEPWREADVLKAEAVRSREEEERGNAMKALENRTKDSKREMDIMEALDEMRSLKARHAGITTEQALAALQREGGAALAEGDADGAGLGDDDAAAAAAAGGAAADDELPEEDKLAMRLFLQQRNTLLRRLDSDGEDSGDEQTVGRRAKQPPAAAAAAAGEDAGPGPGSSMSAPAPAAAAATAAPKSGAPLKPAIKVAVRAKRPAAAAAAAAGGAARLGDVSKKLKPGGAAGGGTAQHRHGPSSSDGAANVLGLVGDYGSSDSEGQS